MSEAIQNTTRRQEKPGLIPGRWVLLATLAMALAVPVAVWVSLQVYGYGESNDKPILVWAERAEWKAPLAKPTVLGEQEGPTPPFEARPRTELPFVMDEDESKQVRELSLVAWALVSQDDNGAAGAVQRAAAEHPAMFYPKMLLALISQHNGDDAAAQRLFAEAFAAAPAAVRLQYVDESHQPIAGLELGVIEIVCAQMQDNNIDETCRLVYPWLVTDGDGWVYLPVYDSVYRVAELPQTSGRRIEYRMPGWFEFPGRVGTLPTAVVRRIDEDDPQPSAMIGQ